MPERLLFALKHTDPLAIGSAGTLSSWALSVASWLFSASAWSVLSLVAATASGLATALYMLLKAWEKWGHIREAREDE